MTAKPLTAALAALALAALAPAGGCSCRGDAGAQTDDAPISNPKAYALGQRQGSVALDAAADTEALEDVLLDTRARVTEPEQKHGRDAASDYRRGFEDAISASNDTLAATLGIKKGARRGNKDKR